LVKYDAGELVLVNLSSGKILRKPCPEHIIDQYLGGRGLASYLLYRFLQKEVEPLSPENMLIFSAGLLCGTRMITSSRLHIGARSPLTGLIGISNGGGKFAAELKACGIIALIVTGRAEKPVFINIEDGKITIEDASFAWGLKTSEARKALREKVLDSKAKIVVIGPAGEKLSSLGCVITDTGHACGRTGMGAIMGSKNLKAVVVRKTRRNGSSASKEVVETVKEYTSKLKKLPCWEEWTTSGSSSSVTWTDEQGASGAKNFSQVTFEGVKTACGSYYKDLVQRYHACYNCPIHCRAFVKIDRGYEKGILTKEKTGGLELNWGNVEAMEAMVHQIANRTTWLGDVLAQGMVKAGRIIGGDALNYAYHVKGLSITIMDPRGFKATGLGYAVSSRGGDFGYVYAKPEYSYTPEQALKVYGTEKAADRLAEEGKALMVRQCVCACAVIDSLGICKIPEFGMIGDFNLMEAARILSAIQERYVEPSKLLKVGERIFNTERLVNLRLGATGQDDTLPRKFLTEPVPEGPSKGSVVNLKKMLREFYSLMGWNENGSISIAKKKELGLEEFAGEEDIEMFMSTRA